MEDEKLAAYYDDLTRRGGGAARFKQGLGFSSNSSPADDVPSRGSALPSTSSFLSGFVKASSPSKTAEFDKQAQLQSIQNKLSKKPKEETRIRSPNRNSGRRSRSRSPSRDRIRDKQSKLRSRSRSRSKDKIRDRHSKRKSRSRSRDRYSRRRSRSRSRIQDKRSRKRSRSREDGSRRKNRSRSRSKSREKNRERSESQRSPEQRRSEKGKKSGEVRGGSGIDFAKLIDGYDNMTPAERVKAKMKLQLSKTAEGDEAIGKGSGWERFDFDKDAPLDDEEIEAVEDDAALVKHIGQSFRFSAVESRKEKEMQAAHDEAMFGAPSYPPPAETDDEEEEKRNENENAENVPITALLSDQVLTMQKKGSWRDRARKP